MICVSLAEKSLDGCVEALKGIPFAEIRMDMMELSLPEVRQLFSGHPNLVATFRPGTRPAAYREAHLLEAIRSGAAYVDVEVDAPSAYRRNVAHAAKSRGCRLIVSFHDYEGTPEAGTLAKIVSSCFRMGADIAKVACMVREPAENARLLGLIRPGRKMVVVGMGEAGRVTRVAAPLCGSVFTFASLASGRETADGQIDYDTLKGYIGLFAHGKGVGS